MKTALKTFVSMADGVRKLYWRIFKPTTYGVKVFILHPDDNGKVLLVRHSYGNSQLYTLPGGGVKRGEDSMQAAIREAKEELSVDLSNLHVLIDEYVSTLEYKKDTIATIGARAVSADLELSSEVAEAKWQNIESVNSLESVSAFVIRAAEAYLNSSK